MIKQYNIVGVDEAGRGPLAGPVVAAAVIIHQNIVEVNDSKMLTHATRTNLAAAIKDVALDISIGICSPAEIDSLNIHNATLLAMQRAVLGLSLDYSCILVDGKFVPGFLPTVALPLIKGDQINYAIAAASIIAKNTRDNIMDYYQKKYPQYDFAAHKGYPTKQHLELLAKFGPSPIHRYSYGPVKQYAGVRVND